MIIHCSFAHPQVEPSKQSIFQVSDHSHTIHVWYIYLHLPLKLTIHVNMPVPWMVWDFLRRSGQQLVSFPIHHPSAHFYQPLRLTFLEMSGDPKQSPHGASRTVRRLKLRWIFFCQKAGIFPWKSWLDLY